MHVHGQGLLVASAAAASGLPGLTNSMPLRLVYICCKKTAFPRGRKGAVECLLDCRCRRRCGVAATDGGFIDVDIQMRTNVPHIFAIGTLWASYLGAQGSARSTRGHRSHLQGNKELAAAAFNARVIPPVTYTELEVALVGLTED